METPTDMQKNMKRTTLLIVGLIIGSWLVFSQKPTTVKSDHEGAESLVEDTLNEKTNELRVKLLLLGAEFVIHTTPQPR